MEILETSASTTPSFKNDLCEHVAKTTLLWARLRKFNSNISQCWRKLWPAKCYLLPFAVVSITFFSETAACEVEASPALTIEVWSEAEHIIAALILVPEAIIPDAGHRVLPPTGLPGLGDGVLHGAVAEPACIAPVQPRPPGVVELIKGGDDGVLVQAGLLSLVEVQVVTTQPRRVGEYNTWNGREGAIWVSSTPKEHKKEKQHFQSSEREIKVNPIMCLTDKLLFFWGKMLCQHISCMVWRGVAATSSPSSSPANTVGSPTGLHVCPTSSSAVPALVSPSWMQGVLKDEKSWKKFCN